MPHTTTTRAPWLSATLPARLIYIEREYVDGERSYIVSIDNALDSGWRISPAGSRSPSLPPSDLSDCHAPPRQAHHASPVLPPMSDAVHQRRGVSRDRLSERARSLGRNAAMLDSAMDVHGVRRKGG
jgi:hypothetical protein